MASADEMSTTRLTLQQFLSSLNPAWNLVGRIHFNLGWTRDAKKLNYGGSVSEKILEEAATVGEALRFYEIYNETAFLNPAQCCPGTCRSHAPQVAPGLGSFEFLPDRDTARSGFHQSKRCSTRRTRSRPRRLRASSLAREF